MFKKLQQKLDRRGKVPIKFRFDLTVSSLEVPTPNSIKQVRLVWARGAKVAVTTTAQVANGVAVWKETLSQVATVYRDAKQEMEPKEYAIKVQASAFAGSDAKMATIGKLTVDFAKYAQLEHKDQHVVLQMPFTFGKVQTKATHFGQLRLKVCGQMLKGMEADEMTEVSVMSGLSSETEGRTADQDLAGFDTAEPEPQKPQPIPVVAKAFNASTPRSREFHGQASEQPVAASVGPVTKDMQMADSPKPGAIPAARYPSAADNEAMLALQEKAQALEGTKHENEQLQARLAEMEGRAAEMGAMAEALEKERDELAVKLQQLVQVHQDTLKQTAKTPRASAGDEKLRALEEKLLSLTARNEELEHELDAANESIQLHEATDSDAAAARVGELEQEAQLAAQRIAELEADLALVQSNNTSASMGASAARLRELELDKQLAEERIAELEADVALLQKQSAGHGESSRIKELEMERQLAEERIAELEAQVGAASPGATITRSAPATSDHDSQALKRSLERIADLEQQLAAASQAAAAAGETQLGRSGPQEAQIEGLQAQVADLQAQLAGARAHAAVSHAMHDDASQTESAGRSLADQRIVLLEREAKAAAERIAELEEQLVMMATADAAPVDSALRDVQQQLLASEERAEAAEKAAGEAETMAHEAVSMLEKSTQEKTALQAQLDAVKDKAQHDQAESEKRVAEALATAEESVEIAQRVHRDKGELEALLQTLQSEQRALKAQADAAAALRAQLEQAQADHSQLVAKLAKTEEQSTAATASLSHVEEELQAAQQARNAAQAQLQSQQEKLEQAMAEAETSALQVAAQAERLQAEASARQAALEEALEVARIEAAQLRQSLAAATTAKAETQDGFLKPQSDADSLIRQLTEEMNAELEERKQVSEARALQLEATTRELAELRSSLEAIKLDNLELSQRCEAATRAAEAHLAAKDALQEQLDGVVAEHRGEMADLLHKFEEAQRLSEDVSAEMAAQVDRLAAFQEEKAQLQDQLNALREENASHRQDAMSLQRQASQGRATRDIEHLQEKTALQQQLAEALGKAEAGHQEKQKLLALIDDLERRVEETEAKAISAIEDQERYEQEFTALKVDLGEARSGQAAAESALASLKQEAGQHAIAAAVAAAVASKQRQVDDLQAAIGELERSKEREVDEVREELLEAREAGYKLEAALRDSEAKRQQMLTEKHSLELNLQETAGDLVQAERQLSMSLGASPDGSPLAGTRQASIAAGDDQGRDAENERIMMELVAKKMELAELHEQYLQVRRELYKAKERNLAIASKMTKLETIVYNQHAAK